MKKKVYRSINFPVELWDTLQSIKDRDNSGISFNRIVINCIIAGLHKIYNIKL